MGSEAEGIRPIEYLSADVLRSFMRDVFIKLGVPEKDSKICADVLICSDLRGIASHGVQRLRMYAERIKAGQFRPVTDFRILRETPTTALVDGNLGMGHVIGHRAMSMAIEKARRYGMGSVAVKNSTHFGIAGYYLLMAVEQGCIGMAATNARSSTAPTHGVEPMLGTNPLAFGFPTDDPFPFVLDCSTSVVQTGKIEIYAREGKPLEPGWVSGTEGETVTDAAAALRDLFTNRASLFPLGGQGECLGGHKGYGYATAVELLCTALQQGPFLQMITDTDDEGKKIPYSLGHFFMAVHIEAFCGLEEFRKTAGAVLRALRASRRIEGQKRIYTAGEKEYEMEKIIRSRGVALNESLQEDILHLKNELGLSQYQFAF